jgi:hypothetical protein
MEKLATGAAPVPLSCNTCCDAPALSVIVRVPVRAPVAVGVKLTEIEHVEPVARLELHVLVWLKSPEAEMPEMFNGALLGLLKEIA